MVDTPCNASPLMNIASPLRHFKREIVRLDQRNTHHATLAIQSDRIIFDALADFAAADAKLIDFWYRRFHLGYWQVKYECGSRDDGPAKAGDDVCQGVRISRYGSSSLLFSVFAAGNHLCFADFLLGILFWRH
ncbi:MAG: hypothetical protein WCB75_24880, partial [Pseudolabrys sp.]